MAWSKGTSGNPRGRPRSSIRAELRRLAALKDARGKTQATLVAERAWVAAIAGDLEAIKWVTDQVDGKLPMPEPESDGQTLRIEMDEGDSRGSPDASTDG